MLAASLTVLSAAVLGGAIAADITAVVVLAAVALVLICAYNGLRNFASVCDLGRDERA
jgi:hypothetical protein